MAMKFKSSFNRINLILSTQLGLNIPLLFRGLSAFPGYVKDLIKFKLKYKGRIILNPCLWDKKEEGGSAKSEYFLQDLYVAQKINQAKPTRHLDIGSRVDGFVAHVASFRNIEVLDIRPIDAVIPGIKFIRANLMDDNYATYESLKTDSLSCLHALEHFGLGRYGDPVDPRGHELGLKNIAKLLKQSGVLYLSMPVGVERVEFNSHRVVDPLWLLNFTASLDLIPTDLAYINSGGVLVDSMDLVGDSRYLAEMPYTLAIFTFQKREC